MITPWAVNFPTGTNPTWEFSNNSGATWTPSPAASQGQVAGGVGVQRYRTVFTIPGGDSGTWTATVSGDIYDNSVNTNAQVWYDGVNQGNVTPLPGPATFTLPVTPGTHTFELRIGGSDGPGITAPNVQFDFANVIADGMVPCDCCPVAAPERCGIAEVPFESVAIAANPAGLPITNLASTIDGTQGADLSGFAPPVSEAQLVANPSTGFDYLFAAPVDNLVRLRWHNGGGGVLTDQDGFGLITVTVLDAGLTPLYTTPWDLTAPIGNNAPPRELNFTAVNGAARVRFDGFHKQNPGVFGTGAPLLRQVEAFVRGPAFPCRRRSGALEWYNEAGNLVDPASLGPC